MTFSFARPEDAQDLLAVYAQYIHTPVTFEYDLPSPETFRDRILDYGSTYPYLVAREGGAVLGYAYAHRQAERAAYQWNAELSVYLDRNHLSRGLGRRLYGALLELLTLQGVKTAHALVSTPNVKSEGLHRAMGFRVLGVQPAAGYKDGAWRDITWFDLPLAPYEPDPPPIRQIGELPSRTVDEILDRYGSGWKAPPRAELRRRG